MTTANDVACFGELLWDFFEQVTPEAKTGAHDSQPIARTFRREIGGASANVASILARLGVKVGAIGAVGDDKFGDALRAELASHGVDVAGVARLKNARTGITFVTRDAAGEPSFVPYRQGTADLAMDESHVSAAMAKVRFAVVGSTSMLPTLKGATMKFLGALEKAKGALVVNLNVRPHLWADADAMRADVADLASRATVVKGSEKDLGALAGKRGMTWLEDNAKGATWVLTRGENGAACVGPHGQVTFPTKRVRCIDATGAGDAFMAGLVAVVVRSGAKPGSAEWKDPKLWSRAMEVGHMLGAKAISAVGATAGIGTLDDLRARIDAPKMSIEPKFRCKAVRSPRGATVTEMDWGDGHKGILPHDILRGYCPCAGCQGHEGTIKFLKPTSKIQMEIDKIDPVGNYALQLTWFDGHSSGIYSYKFLRALCQCDECRPGAAKEERADLPRS